MSVKKAFEDISPIKDSTGKLSLYLTFDPENSESIGPATHTEAECVERGLTYQCPIFVEAEFRNGVLTVRLPKAPEARPRRIEVKAE